jgi:oligopeptide transport system substrate-binding protein
MMVEGKYDIAFGGWGGDYNHPMTFLELFTSTAYDNATRWKNADYDALIDQARATTDEAKQLDLFVKAEHLLMEESPIVPLFVPSGAIMMQKNVTNWFITASDTLYITHAEITR